MMENFKIKAMRKKIWKVDNKINRKNKIIKRVGE
jgi:hypothetical protein